MGWIGRLIGYLEARGNRSNRLDRKRRIVGTYVLMIVLLATLVPTLLLEAVLFSLSDVLLSDVLGALILAFLVSTLLAQRSLYTHVAAVAERLEREGLAGGRTAVAKIVGRDPESLDEAGVARAAIESLAENFSDGVVAPAFYCGLFGLPGIAMYKAANTADSMIGHKSERYRAFGWAAARFDDLINLPASRLTSLLVASAALVLPNCDAGAALQAVRRDAQQHRSPNAGFPEAAFAGALGLRLAGPRHYSSETVADAWMGDGRAEATAADIRQALQLYRAAALLQILGVAILVWVT